MITIGCKANSKSNTADLSTDKIADYIKDKIVFKDDLQKIDDKDMLKKIYPAINTDYIDEFSVYISASGATAEELSVFKLNNKNYVGDMKQIIEDRKNSQISNFENYIPEEVYKIKNSVTDINENIVAYISCDTPTDIETILEKLYNNK